MRRVVMLVVLLGDVATAGQVPQVPDCLGRGLPRPRTETTRVPGYWVQGPTGPSPRMTTMVYDPVGLRTVLYGGGKYQQVAYGDTWFYDGASWLQGPTAGPEAHHGMAYDVARQRIVMVGGSTWQFDGTAWSWGPSGPSGSFLGLAYDQRRSRTVLFGGWTGQPLGETWEFDGTTWTQVFPASSPSARWGPAMAYDPRRGVTVLVGGADAAWLTMRDTWEYDGTTWTPAPMFPGNPVMAATMVYVDSAQTLALFGGWSAGCGATIGDIYFFDGASWTWGLSLTGGERWGHGMSYDAARNRIVVFGGDDGLGSAFGDTWEYVMPCTSLTLLPPAMPDARLGLPYSAQITAVGGVAPYQFTISGGSLPPGISLGGAGLVSGTPTTVGTWAFDVAAVDSGGCQGSRSYVLRVRPAAGIAAGQGHGLPNPNRVRVHTALGAPTTFDLYAYAAGSWGANVACGRVDGDVVDEVLTGPGPGPTLGPQVKAYRTDGTPLAKVNFYAFSTLRYGVNVANLGRGGSGADGILAGAGPGDVFGPHVRGFSFDGATVQPLSGLSFFAYATLQMGVVSEGGDLDGADAGEIVTGPGPGATFGPHVRGFAYTGAQVVALAKVNFFAATTLRGARVAAGDADGDGFAEIVEAPGPDPAAPARILGFDYDASSVRPAPGFDATVGATMYGGRVATADTLDAAPWEILAAPGPQPSAPARVTVLAYDGAALTTRLTYSPFWQGYGVNVAAGDLAVP